MRVLIGDAVAFRGPGRVLVVMRVAGQLPPVAPVCALHAGSTNASEVAVTIAINIEIDLRLFHAFVSSFNRTE